MTEASRELRAAVGRGGGKIILLGEHVVVHGRPAISAGLPLGAEVSVEPAAALDLPDVDDGRVAAAIREASAALLGTDAPHLRIRLGGDLPVAVGLGSSAALSVALVRALAGAAGVQLSESEVEQRANALERLFHGTPSGIDAATATHGGVMRFVAGDPPRHEPARLRGAVPLVIGFSGSPHETGRTVASLRERAAAQPPAFEPVFDAVGRLVDEGWRALQDGDLPLLGALMTMNHGLLRALGVSTPELDAGVDAALGAGALGAKLTGGGGGGAFIALAADPGGLVAALRSSGYDAFESVLQSGR